MASGNTLAVFGALDNSPPTSNYATLDLRNNHPVLDFDDTTAESAVFGGVVASQLGASASVTVNIFWTATTATSGNVIWTAAVEKTTGQDIDSDGFATGIDSSAAATNATSGILTKTTITLTNAQADSIAAGDAYRIKVTRKAADASDTMTGDAELLRVSFKEA